MESGKRAGTMTDRLYLNGADFFFLGLDRLMRHDGQNGNVGQMVVELDGRIDEATVASGFARLAERLPWLHGYARRRWFVGLPYWQPPVNGAAREADVAAHGEADDPESLLSQALSSGLGPRGPRARFDLLERRGEGSTLAMTWDHALMDARGAALFLRAMDPIAGDDSHTNTDALRPAGLNAARDPRSLRERNRDTQRYFAMMREIGRRAILSPGAGRSLPGAGSVYRTLRFDAEESRRVLANAATACGHLSETPFLLAAATRAVDGLFAARGERPDGYVMPVAYDARLKGATGPVLSNQVSFFFYQAGPEAIACRDALAREMRRQTVDQLRNDMPAAADTALCLGRRFPHWWHTRLRRRSFGDEFGSFFFSNTGSLFEGRQTLFGAPIRNAFSVPAMPRRPGFGLAFNRFDGRLNAVVAWADGALADDEREGLIERLRAELLEESVDA
jgi:diacylglycerol O-acyltransferase